MVRRRSLLAPAQCAGACTERAPVLVSKDFAGENAAGGLRSYGSPIPCTRSSYSYHSLLVC
jgi:hypothetical protein